MGHRRLTTPKTCEGRYWKPSCGEQARAKPPVYSGSEPLIPQTLREDCARRAAPDGRPLTPKEDLLASFGTLAKSARALSEADLAQRSEAATPSAPTTSVPRGGYRRTAKRFDRFPVARALRLYVPEKKIGGGVREGRVLKGSLDRPWWSLTS